MKFAFAIACLFVVSASAFAPALSSAKNKQFVPWEPMQRLKASNPDILEDDALDAGDAVARYGRGGRRNPTTFGVDIDDDIAGYAGADCHELDTMDEDIDSTFDEDRPRNLDGRGPSANVATAKVVTPKINCFGLPGVSKKSHSLLTEWSFGSGDQGIEVVLVTQCSLDRLQNLQAQLASWTGKASIAIYLKPGENKLDAIDDILSNINIAKDIAGNKSFDAAITLVEGYMEGEPYPINYLRNVALLEAQRQHLRFSNSLDKSSAFLVDVDFCPSSNLHEILHSKSAADYILKEGKVVVCPTFECIKQTCPDTIASLKELVDKEQAEGFHQSHFPQGHGPTQFDTFWEKSLNYPTSTNGDIQDYFWNESYDIVHEELFEPYIVMASSDIPLYDERFQGYGLNKISHLKSVSTVKGGEYLVLPGVFLVAPTHERSESWGKIYGNPRSDENRTNRLALKALYHDFQKNLRDGRSPVVSENTRARQELMLKSIG